MMSVEATHEPLAQHRALDSDARVRPLSPAAKNALKYIGKKWQKVPHQIRASHLAVLIRHGHIEHRWPFDFVARMAISSVGCMPWLREGEIRLRPND